MSKYSLEAVEALQKEFERLITALKEQAQLLNNDQIQQRLSAAKATLAENPGSAVDYHVKLVLEAEIKRRASL